MKNSEGKRKKRLVGLTVAMSTIMIAGGALTLSAMTDVERVSDNQITAGKLDMIVTQKNNKYNGTAAPAGMNFDPPTADGAAGANAESNQGNVNKRIRVPIMKPGDTVEFDLDVENANTIPFTYGLASSTVTFVNGGCIDTGDNSDSIPCTPASPALNVEMSGDIVLASTALNSANVSNLNSAVTVTADDNAAGGTDVSTVHVKITWPATGDPTGTEGGTVDIDLVFKATQV